MESIEVHGYAILEGVLRPHDICRIQEDLASSSLLRSRAGARHALHAPSGEALARNTRLLGLAKLILGPGAVPFRATLFEKTHSANWLVVWHQDTALPLCRRLDVPGWGRLGP